VAASGALSLIFVSQTRSLNWNERMSMV